MNRIAIVGSPGAGKTTLAKQLADITELPVIHLDFYYHQKQFDYYDDLQAWTEKVNELTGNEQWIMDGNYTSTMPQRFEKADVIIFLDVPRYKAFYRIFKRRFQYRKKVRTDMPDQWREKISREFLVYVWKYRSKRRQDVYSLVNKHSNDKKAFVLRNKQQVRDFILTMENQQ